VKTTFNHPRVLFMILSLSVLILASSCGGGGGGGGDGDGNGNDDGGGQTLNEYNFRMDFGASDGPLPLEVAAILGDEEVTATLEGSPGGSYILDPESVAFDAGPMVRITTNLWPGPLGILNINLSNDIKSIDGNHPEEGTMTVHIGDEGILYSLTTTFTVAGVNLKYNDGTPINYTWSQFEDLLGSSVPDWQQQASFAYNIVSFLFSQVSYIVSVFPLIDEGDSVTTGDTLPAGVLPDGFSNPGTRTLTDINGGEPQPGDTFRIDFQHFWKNDTSDDIDPLYDGTVRFVNFWRTSVNDTITGIGFAPYQGSGGVFFDGLRIYEIEENSPGSFTLDDTATMTINGGYTILFSQP